MFSPFISHPKWVWCRRSRRRTTTLDGRVARRTATDLSQSRAHAGEDRLGPRGAVTSSAAPHVFLARAKVSIADDDKLKKNQRVRKESASQDSYRLLFIISRRQRRNDFGGDYHRMASVPADDGRIASPFGWLATERHLAFVHITPVVR